MNPERAATPAAPARRTRTYTNAGLAVLGLVVFAMLMIARRDSAELRRQIETLRDAQWHRAITPHRIRRSDTTARAPDPAVPEPALTGAELKPALVRLFQGCARRGIQHFRSGLWPSGADMEAMFARVPPKDLPRALVIISGFPPGDPRAELWHALFRHWAGVDPAAAAAVALTLPPQEAPIEQGIVADVWAVADPAAALAYFGPTENVFTAYAQKFPAQAARIAMGDHRANSRGPEIDSVARAWFAKAPTAAWAWALTLPDSDRGFAMQSMLGGMATIDAQSVEAFVAGQTQPTQEMLRPEIAQAAASLAAKDLVAAREWVMQLPSDTPAHEAALDGLVRTWAIAEPQSAATWIGDLPEPDRTRAIRRFFTVPGNVEPDLVTLLVNRTDDGRLRHQILAILGNGNRTSSSQ